VRAPALILAPLATALVALLAGAATGADETAAVTANTWAIKVIVPGQEPVSSRVVTAPPDAVSYDGAFADPADGSLIAADSVTTSASTADAPQATAGATAQVTSLSLFNGEIVASSITGEAHAVATGASATGDAGVSAVTGLVVLGQPVTPTPNQQLPLADWGTATVLEEQGQPTHAAGGGFAQKVIALDIVLTADHDGLPAQTEIQIGYADATAAAPAAPTTTETTTTAPTTTVAPPVPQPHKPKKKAKPKSRPLTVTPPLGGTGERVFPVFGEASYGDTYGAERSDVPGGWHHGDDIFATLGAPVLAVAHGTVFSVGWNKVGGWRLWVRDDAGNEFYYAHLSAYTPLAVNGAIVNPGDVLGFVGNTGDAEGTPYHLHFEVHPVGYLGLGYDGAVDPTTYLQSWTKLVNIRFDAAAGWLPAQSGTAPKAGAILLQSSDISTGSGLDRASLARAFAPPPGAVTGEGGGQLPTQPPAARSSSGG
jgi:murein DD-endopeptidase MepM/ murein hydrolase activator NlpD